MKKLHSLMACALIACASLVLFSSCEGGGSSLSGYAPKSITGKTFNDYLHFDTSSSFSFTEESGMESDDICTVTTNGYKYKKTGDDTADLTYEYSLDYHKYEYSEYFQDRDEKVTLHLHFTSSEAGWYTSSGTSYADFSLY